MGLVKVGFKCKFAFDCDHIHLILSLLITINLKSLIKSFEPKPGWDTAEPVAFNMFDDQFKIEFDSNLFNSN